MHYQNAQAMHARLQVHASAQSLKLCAFDADGTLYADGAHIEHDNQMVSLIVSLMRHGIYVAIVTAAGYPGEADRFEQRIEGLVNAFRRLRLPSSVTDRCPPSPTKDIGF